LQTSSPPLDENDDDIQITVKDIILQPFLKGDEDSEPPSDRHEEHERHHGKQYLI
jgi:hypothetical protein